MKYPTRKEVQEIVNKLQKLWDDPHTGMSSWCELERNRLQDMSNALHIMGITPTVKSIGDNLSIDLKKVFDIKVETKNSMN